MTPKAMWWPHKLVSEAQQEGLKDLAKGLCGSAMSCIRRETQIAPWESVSQP